MPRVAVGVAASAVLAVAAAPRLASKSRSAHAVLEAKLAKGMPAGSSVRVERLDASWMVGWCRLNTSG